MRNLNKKKIALLTACVVSAVGHMAFAAEAEIQRCGLRCDCDQDTAGEKRGSAKR